MALRLYGMGKYQATASMCVPQHKKEVPITSDQRVCYCVGKRVAVVRGQFSSTKMTLKFYYNLETRTLHKYFAATNKLQLYIFLQNNINL